MHNPHMTRNDFYDLNFMYYVYMPLCVMIIVVRKSMHIHEKWYFEKYFDYD